MMHYVIRFPGGSSNTVSEKYCAGRYVTAGTDRVTDERPDVYGLECFFR